MFLVLMGFSSVFGTFYPFVIEIITGVTTLVLFVLNRRGIKRDLLFVIFIVILVSLFQSLILKNPLNNYIAVNARTINMCLLIGAFSNNVKELKYHLVRALYVVMWFSIFNLVLLYLPFNLFTSAVADNGYYVNTIVTLFNKNATTDLLGVSFERNQSLFSEPGVLSILLTILLYHELFEEKKNVSGIVFGIIFTLLSTISTTGFVALFILLGYKFFIQHRFNLRMLIPFLFFLPVLVLELNNKLIEGVGKSFALRSYDFLMGLEVLKNHWVLGTGFDPNTYENLIDGLSIVVFDDVMSEVRGNTNAILQLFIYIGLPLGVFVLRALYQQQIFVCRRKVFFIIILLGFISEPMLLTNLTFLFILTSNLIDENKFAWQKNFIYSPNILRLS